MGTILVAMSTRAFLQDFFNGPCVMRVVVDGLLQPSPDLRQLPPPDEIHGVEVFAGAASVPVQYAGIGEGKMCGLIAVWTR